MHLLKLHERHKALSFSYWQYKSKVLKVLPKTAMVYEILLLVHNRKGLLSLISIFLLVPWGKFCQHYTVVLRKTAVRTFELPNFLQKNVQFWGELGMNTFSWNCQMIYLYLLRCNCKGNSLKNWMERIFTSFLENMYLFKGNLTTDEIL